MARPSKYRPKVVVAICERLSKGEPLAAICRDEDMPSDDTVRNWMAREDVGAEVSRAIARAREAGEEWIAAECLEIADTPRLGVIEKLEPMKSADGTLELVVTERRMEDMLGHRKLQIDTRLKLLAKWNPKKWGDKTAVDLSSSDGTMTPRGLADFYAALPARQSDSADT